MFVCLCVRVHACVSMYVCMHACVSKKMKERCDEEQEEEKKKGRMKDLIVMIGRYKCDYFDNRWGGVEQDAGLSHEKSNNNRYLSNKI